MSDHCKTCNFSPNVLSICLSSSAKKRSPNSFLDAFLSKYPELREESAVEISEMVSETDSDSEAESSRDRNLLFLVFIDFDVDGVADFDVNGVE
jgi:hypothetical protein